MKPFELISRSRERDRLCRPLDPRNARSMRRLLEGRKVVVLYNGEDGPKWRGWFLVMEDNMGVFSNGRFETRQLAVWYLWKYGINAGITIKP